MSRNKFTTWPLRARILWITALLLDIIGVICGIVNLINHFTNVWFSWAMPVLMFVAAGCFFPAIVIIVGREQAPDLKHTAHNQQE